MPFKLKRSRWSITKTCANRKVFSKFRTDKNLEASVAKSSWWNPKIRLEIRGRWLLLCSQAEEWRVETCTFRLHRRWAAVYTWAFWVFSWFHSEYAERVLLKQKSLPLCLDPAVRSPTCYFKSHNLLPKLHFQPLLGSLPIPADKNQTILLHNDGLRPFPLHISSPLGFKSL